MATRLLPTTTVRRTQAARGDAPTEAEGEGALSREFRAAAGITAGIFRGLFIDLPKLIAPGAKEGEIGWGDLGRGIGRSFKSTFTGENIRRAMRGEATWTEALAEDLLNIGSIAATVGSLGTLAPAVLPATAGARAAIQAGAVAGRITAGMGSGRTARLTAKAAEYAKTAAAAGRPEVVGTTAFKYGQFMSRLSRPYRTTGSTARNLIDSKIIKGMQEGQKLGPLGSRAAPLRTALLDAAQSGKNMAQTVSRGVSHALDKNVLRTMAGPVAATQPTLMQAARRGGFTRPWHLPDTPGNQWPGGTAQGALPGFPEQAMLAGRTGTEFAQPQLVPPGRPVSPRDTMAAQQRAVLPDDEIRKAFGTPSPDAPVLQPGRREARTPFERSEKLFEERMLNAERQAVESMQLPPAVVPEIPPIWPEPIRKATTATKLPDGIHPGKEWISAIEAADIKQASTQIFDFMQQEMIGFPPGATQESFIRDLGQLIMEQRGLAPETALSTGTDIGSVLMQGTANIAEAINWRAAMSASLNQLGGYFRKVSVSDIPISGTELLPAAQLRRMLRQTDTASRKMSGNGGGAQIVKKINEKFGDGMPDWFNEHVAALGDDAAFLVPRGFAKMMRSWEKHTKLGNMFDFGGAPLALFRSAVLSHSPRWTINSFAGNFMNSILAEPLSFLEWFQAFRQAREKATPTRFATGGGVGGEFAAVKQQRGLLGTRIGRFAAGENPVARAITRSNSFVDEMARIAVYRRKFKRDLRHVGSPLGIDEIESMVRKGQRIPEHIQKLRIGTIEEAARLMVDYGRKTPLERSVLRSIFPFYSWQKGIVRLALTLPMDHPLRSWFMVQVSNQFGGYSKEERETLPDFMIPSARVGIGPIDRVLIRGVNPYADVPALLDPRRLAQNMNPIGQAAIRLLGREVPGARRFVTTERDIAGFATPPTDAARILTELGSSLIPGMPQAGPVIPVVQDLPGVRQRGVLPQALLAFGINIRDADQMRALVERTEEQRRIVAGTRRRLDEGPQPRRAAGRRTAGPILTRPPAGLLPR